MSHDNVNVCMCSCSWPGPPSDDRILPTAPQQTSFDVSWTLNDLICNIILYIISMPVVPSEHAPNLTDNFHVNWQLLRHLTIGACKRACTAATCCTATCPTATRPTATYPSASPDTCTTTTSGSSSSHRSPYHCTDSQPDGRAINISTTAAAALRTTRHLYLGSTLVLGRQAHKPELLGQ